MPPSPSRSPFTVSFVLATYNRGPVVADCLRHTLSCGLPQHQFNIIVVDNASTDATPNLVDALARQHPGRLRLIRLTTNCGPVAKNIALANNPADILILLDDDAYPLPGAVPQALRHFHDDPRLGAAVFDVTLPDATREASAYPDVFIGAGTALRRTALHDAARGPAQHRPGRGLLPADFFMQAEEYDLSFRLLHAGWSVQRFADMPLMHLKSPGARIGHRTTRLDIRNNLWLLARYLPAPLCHQFAADWLARYFHLSVRRDRPGAAPLHKKAFLRGAAEGLATWSRQRADESLLLSPNTLERIFKFNAIRERLQHLKDQRRIRRIALGDWGKNLLPFLHAARQLDLEITAILDPAADVTASPQPATRHRGIPLLSDSAFRETALLDADVILITAMSHVHAARRQAALQRILPRSLIVNLFAKSTPGQPLQPLVR